MPISNPSGLTVRVLRQAPKGRVLQSGDLVGVFYAGKLTDGTQFDANFNYNGFQPVPDRDLFVFTLDQGQVIEGWDLALQGLRIGEVVELTIPSELAYGSTARPGIPANSTLVFTVVLVGMIPKDQLALPPKDQKAIFCDLTTLGLKPAKLGLTPALLQRAPLSIVTGNFLVGTDQADTITGQDDQSELLIGLLGDDDLSGNGSGDLLSGGLGADTFHYNALTDSAPGTRDVITDFKAKLGDRIDLSAIDANTGLDGNQTFRYIGAAAFSGVAGELRYKAGQLSADVDGNKQADLVVELLKVAKLAEGNLIL